MAKKTTKIRYGIQSSGCKAGKGTWQHKSSSRIRISENTMYAWTKAAKEGQLDTGYGSHTPQTAMTLAEKVQMLRRQNKEQEKEIRRLKEENAFFATSRQKPAKGRE